MGVSFKKIMFVLLGFKKADFKVLKVTQKVLREFCLKSIGWKHARESIN